MKISGINNFLPPITGVSEAKTNKQQFGNLLTDFIQQVNLSQNSSNQLTKDFIAGEDVELHEVMIAGEKAKTNLDLLMEIRNKALDMYKELTRMQI